MQQASLFLQFKHFYLCLVQLSLCNLTILIVLQGIEDILHQKYLSPEIDCPYDLIFARLYPHKAEKFPQHTLLMLALDKVSHGVDALTELGSLQPVLHYGSQEEAVRKPLFLLSQQLFLVFDLQEEMPLIHSTLL